MDEIGKLNPILDQKYEEYQDYIRQREEILSAQAQAQDAQLQQEQHQRHHHYQQQQQRDVGGRAQDEQGPHFTGNPPMLGWSLAKALEGVPGTNLSQTGHHPNQHHHAHQQSHEIASQVHSREKK